MIFCQFQSGAAYKSVSCIKNRVNICVDREKERERQRKVEKESKTLSYIRNALTVTAAAKRFSFGKSTTVV